MSPTGRRAATALAGATLALSGLLTLAGGAQPVRAASTVDVSMRSFAFMPASVTVHAGDTVTWTYDEKPTDIGCENPIFHVVPSVSCPGHSTTSTANGPDGRPLWDSGVHRAAGFPYSRTFTVPGTYPYYCIVHGGPHPNNPVTHMNGTIVVLAAATTPASPAPVAPVTGSTGAPAQAAPSTLGAPDTGAGLPVLGFALLAGGLTLVVTPLAEASGMRRRRGLRG